MLSSRRKTGLWPVNMYPGTSRPCGGIQDLGLYTGALPFLHYLPYFHHLLLPHPVPSPNSPPPPYPLSPPPQKHARTTQTRGQTPHRVSCIRAPHTHTYTHAQTHTVNSLVTVFQLLAGDHKSSVRHCGGGGCTHTGDQSAHIYTQAHCSEQFPSSK